MWYKLDFKRQISDTREKPDKQPTKVALENPTGTRYSFAPKNPTIPLPEMRVNPTIKPNIPISHSAPPVNTQHSDNSFTGTTGGLSIRGTNDSVKSQPNPSPAPAKDEAETNGTKSGFLVSIKFPSTFSRLGGLSTTTNVKTKSVVYEAMELVIVVSYDTKRNMTTNIESCEFNKRKQLIESYIDVFN